MKKVILKPENENVVTLDVVDGNRRTYIAIFDKTGYKYKLHRVGNKCAFVHLLSCECYANGFFDDIKSAISSSIRQGADVYEISNTEDFIKCLRL